MQEKTRCTFCMPPCPAYDIAATVQWLEEMAQDGLILQKISMGIAVFICGERQRLRYQLRVLPGNNMLTEDGTFIKEEEHFIAYCEMQGWKFVTRYEKFAVFVTDDVILPDLNDDEDVQLMHLEDLRKQQKASLVNIVMSCLAIPLMFQGGQPLLQCLAVGTELYALVAFSFLCTAFASVRDLIRQHKLRTRMLDGIRYETDWREGALAYKLGRLLPIISWTLLIVFLLPGMAGSYETDKKERVQLSEYTEPLPFARLEDIIADGVDIDTDTNDTIHVEHDILAPLMLTVSQQDRYRMNDDTVRDYGVYAQYYEMLHPALAIRLAEELHEEDKDRWEGRYVEYTLPELDVDYAIAYEAFNPTLILVEKKSVLVVSLDSYGKEPLPLETWSRVYAESMKT